MTAGFWHTNFFCSKFWVTDFWPEFGTGAIKLLTGTISFVISLLGKLTIGGWDEISKPAADWSEYSKPTNGWSEVGKPSNNWSEV